MAFFSKSADQEGDERIAKRADNGLAREDRAATDRNVSENREVSDPVRGAERRAVLRDTNTLLPPPPAVDGYHSFWATTTNPKDTVESRQRLGYSFITRAEAPGFELSSLKSGETSEDRIMINEMVAMKLPLDLWKEDMIDIHHTMPLEQTNNLKNSLNIFKDGRGKSVAYTGAGFDSGVADGYSSLNSNKAPSLKGVA